MEYRFLQKFAKVDPLEVWKQIQQRLSRNEMIKSITGVPYMITSVNTLTISYTSPKRSSGVEEDLGKSDFIEIVLLLQKQGVFNTSNSKDSFPNKIKRKRSPTFAILIATGVIEPIV